MNDNNDKIISENNLLISNLSDELKDIQKSINAIDIE